MSKFIKNQIKSGENDFKEIWRRIRKRDFSGNTGIAIKNSVHQFSTNFVSKIGSLIFTIILARLLMPELFGYYSLALSTILVFGVLSKLGIETTLVRFISKEIKKNNGRIKSYLIYLGKIKIFLIFFTAIIILFSARYIANSFYNKPILLALLAGILYTFFNQISVFLKSMLQASNNFSSIFKRELIFQISRIILVPSAVILAIRYSISEELNLMLIIILLSFSLFLASLFMFFDIKKIYSGKINKEKSFKLSRKKKEIINKFLIATATLTLSGLFFGVIDKIMLGKFVSGEFIGYYTSAHSLIGALAALVGFSSVVLLPIFSRLEGKRLERGLKKSIKIILIFSLGMFIITITSAYYIIFLTYGKSYLISTNILRIFSLLLFITPLIGIYQSYLISQGKPGTITKFLIASTILNILLNYFLINILLPYGELMAVYGVTFSTLISQIFYLGGLLSHKRININ
jgi:O-antigen/teichoic acid export membrane protein